jgi:putative transposase
MFIADGLKGLKQIINDEFPGAKLQRCLVHKIRNILLRARTDDKQILSNDFRNVLN